MVSDSDMGMEGGSAEEEEAQGTGMSESSGSYGAEAGGMSAEEEQETSPVGGAPSGEGQPAKPKRGGGRRAALKIIRQNVESVSRDLAGFRKAHEVSTKKLEKQVSSLSNDLNAFKSYLAKESAKARSKQEAAFNRVFAKLNPPKPKKKAPAKKKAAAKPKSKGKK
jgi:hypothetical protein